MSSGAKSAPGARAATRNTTPRHPAKLLHFWFKNEERDFHAVRYFFAQQEAIEVAIFVNEIAERSNVGQRILSGLGDCAICDRQPPPGWGSRWPPGTGKTVVMGALIVYHFFNRLEYRNDTRFADNFLLIAPGITIRDRLAALRVDNRPGIEATDYYPRTLLGSARSELAARDAAAQTRSSSS